MTQLPYLVRVTVGAALMAAVFAGCRPANSKSKPRPSAALSGDAEADAAIDAYERGDHQEAAAAFKRALRKGVQQHEEDTLHTMLGNAYNELEQFEESIAAHRQALQLNPRNHEAWVNLGIVYRLTDDLEEAERCYQKALELKPDYPELHASLGALYIFQEKPERAVAALEKAVQLDRQSAVAHANLALAYATVGRFDEADAKLKRAIVLGYQNGPIIKERIAALKAIQD